MSQHPHMQILNPSMLTYGLKDNDKLQLMADNYWLLSNIMG